MVNFKDMGWAMNMRALALLLILGAAEANAAEWYRLSKSSDGESLTFIDSSSLSTTPQGLRRAWLYSINKDKSSNKYLESVKCKARERGILSYINYTADGKVENNYNVKAATYSPAVPETIGEATLDAICSPSIKQFAIKRGGYYAPLPMEAAEIELSPDAPAAEAAEPAEESEAHVYSDQPTSQYDDILRLPSHCVAKCADGYMWAIANRPLLRKSCSTLPTTTEGSGCLLWMEQNR